MENKELTNGSSANCGVFTTDERGILDLPPEKAKKLTIVTIANIKKIEKDGVLELKASNYDIIRDSDGKVRRRIDAETKKVLTDSKVEEKVSADKADDLEQ